MVKSQAEEILRQARASAEEIISELKRVQSGEADFRERNEILSKARQKLNAAEEKIAPKAEEAPVRKSSRAVKAGDVVELLSMSGIKATVVSVGADRSLVLQAGIMRVTAAEVEVYLLENEKPKDTKTFAEESSAALSTTVFVSFTRSATVRLKISLDWQVAKIPPQPFS